MWNNYLKKIKSGVSVFMCICLLAGSVAMVPLNSQGEVQEAEALFGIGDVVYDPKNAVFNSMQAALQDFFYIKEFTLDGIASGLAKLMLKSITQSILTWINSGFQGSPAFVTDLKQFLLDQADLAAGDFIYGSELGFLCSPFALDVKIALATSYQEEAYGETTAQCTLSDVTDNVEGFLSGTFSDGGWASWFEVTQNPANTPTGAYLEAEAEMYARIVDEEGNTIKELDWGSGFLSFKVCGDTQSAGGGQEDCTITTPGKVIEDALTVNLQSGTQALIEADEINEIIGALFAQLAQVAITGVNGLLGLDGGSGFSDNSYGDTGDNSYLDALAAEDTISGGLGNPFVDAINLEGENVTLQKEIVAIINGVEGRLGSAIQAEGACIGITMPSALIDTRTQAVVLINNSATTVETLLALNETFLNPASPPEQIEAIETYQQMSGAGTIMNDATINEIRFFIDYDLAENIDDLNTRIRSAVNRCDDDDD